MSWTLHRRIAARSAVSRLLWFVGLWLAGVAVVAAVSYAIRFALL